MCIYVFTIKRSNYFSNVITTRLIDGHRNLKPVVFCHCASCLHFAEEKKRNICVMCSRLSYGSTCVKVAAGEEQGRL